MVYHWSHRNLVGTIAGVSGTQTLSLSGIKRSKAGYYTCTITSSILTPNLKASSKEQQIVVRCKFGLCFVGYMIHKLWTGDV